MNPRFRICLGTWSGNQIAKDSLTPICEASFDIQDQRFANKVVSNNATIIGRSMEASDVSRQGQALP